MTFVQSVVTALPPHRYTSEEIINVARGWLTGMEGESERFERVVRASKIRSRSFALPAEKIVALRGAQERSDVFICEGTKLASSVLSRAFVDHEHLKTLIFTSCSVPVIPSIDARSLNELSFSPEITRIPLYQHGCVGGAVGLGLGAKLCEKDGDVAVLSVELCSLVHQSLDTRGVSLVGSALFGDGAACVRLSKNGGPLRIRGSQTLLIPNTVELMGFDIFDDGSHLRLDRELPSAVIRHSFQFVESFLAKFNLTPAEIPHWLFHPGGVKILQAFESLFTLQREQLKWSWEVLAEYGNMSSASVLFVLEAYLRDKEWRAGEKALMFGIGPGLTLELILFEAAA